MNDAPADHPTPQAPLAPAPPLHSHTIHWGGLIWAVPLAALAVVVFLGVRAFTDRGIDVVVTFDLAAGARVDDTKVIYQGVEAGRVTAIDINPDGHRVDMTLRMDRRAESGLNSSTQFWLIGAKPNLSDISSFKAAVAGLAIGVASGTGGVSHTPLRRDERAANHPAGHPRHGPCAQLADAGHGAGRLADLLSGAGNRPGFGRAV
jgi:paraquat-inducible protein B